MIPDAPTFFSRSPRPGRCGGGAHHPRHVGSPFGGLWLPHLGDYGAQGESFKQQVFERSRRVGRTVMVVVLAVEDDDSPQAPSVTATTAIATRDRKCDLANVADGSTGLGRPGCDEAGG